MLNQQRYRRSPGIWGTLLALFLGSHAGIAQAADKDADETASADESDDDSSEVENASAEEETDAPSPISYKNGGPWWLVGDANLSTVNFRDSGATFSVGLHLWTDKADFMVLVRKGISATVDGREDKRAFSSFILNPSKTDLGASLYASLYPWQVKRFITDEVDFRLGPTLRFDIGSADWRYMDSESVERTDSANAFRLTAGVSAQFKGKVGENLVAILGHVGPTLRFVGGDIATATIGDTKNTYYDVAMGTNRKHAWGGEFGFGVRINGLEVYAEVPFLWMTDGPGVPGLTGGQFVQTVTLRAPVDL